MVTEKKKLNVRRYNVLYLKVNSLCKLKKEKKKKVFVRYQNSHWSMGRNKVSAVGQNLCSSACFRFKIYIYRSGCIPIYRGKSVVRSTASTHSVISTFMYEKRKRRKKNIKVLHSRKLLCQFDAIQRVKQGEQLRIFFCVMNLYR